MLKKGMYSKIQQQKRQGMKISEISRVNKLDRKTARKYYSMNEEEYTKYIKSKMNREKVLDKYRDSILNLYKINNFQKLNMSAVYDYLEEHYGRIECTEKTLRNYINKLIIDNEIKLKFKVRMVEKVEELPFGKQLQIDFGQYVLQSEKRIYIFAAVLSSSRYKFVAVQDRPFKTIDVIHNLYSCFEYIGGIPEEIVIDQDVTMVVSENHGDILYTREFQDFKTEMKFSMYVCRKSDPESKGKVENLVGYVKKNFFSIRDFTDMKSLSEQLMEWLSRKANGKISLSTGLIPSEVIKSEREFLKPLKSSIFRRSSIDRENRIVSQKSYISFRTCLYSIPVEFRNKLVEIEIINGNIIIYFNNKIIAEHKISIFKGKIINKREHFRETSKKASTLKEETLSFYDFPEWEEFVVKNFKEFPRYVRDQCIYAKKHLSEKIDITLLKNSISYCFVNQLYSFKNLFESYSKFLEESVTCSNNSLSPIKSIHPDIPKIIVRKRDLKEYSSIVFGKRGN